MRKIPLLSAVLEPQLCLLLTYSGTIAARFFKNCIVMASFGLEGLHLDNCTDLIAAQFLRYLSVYAYKIEISLS